MNTKKDEPSKLKTAEDDFKLYFEVDGTYTVRDEVYDVNGNVTLIKNGNFAF